MAAGSILKKLATNADAGDVNLPKGRDLEKTFKSKTATSPNMAGQGKVRKPRSQILIENYRSNPNGVRTQFLNLPEDVKMNILQEIAEDFPPARPGEPLSGAGMELYQFLTEGDGIADSPTRRQVLAADNYDGMRPGPMESRGDSFVKREYSEGPLGPTGDETADVPVTFTENPESTGIVDNSPPDNPQNMHRSARDAAARVGYAKGGLATQESFRGNKRFADVEDGQPTNRAIPGTGRLSDAAATEVSPNGEKFARNQIKQGSKTSNQASDGVAAMDNSNYDNSFQEAIVGLMNNSRNPDALAGNRIDQLWNMVSNTDADPRTLFGSPEAFVKTLMGYVSPKMVDNMTNPSPIGQQLPPSLRSQKSFEIIEAQLLKQANQFYTNADGSNGFGAATPDDLSRPSPILEPDGVNNPDSDLDSVSPIGDLDDLPESTYDNQTDFRDLYDPVGPREEPSGAPPGSAKDRMMSAETNQQDRFDLFQERMDELMAEGLPLDKVVEVMADEGLGPEFLKAGPDQVAGVERFGIPKTPGTNPSGKTSPLGKQVQKNRPPKRNKGPLPPPPRSVKDALEQKIGANGPQKTAEQAPSGNMGADPVSQALNELNLAGVSQDEMYKIIGGGPDAIIKAAEELRINKQANGPIPPKNTDKKASDGDLSSSGGGEQLNSLDSAATELPADTNVFDTGPNKADAGTGVEDVNKTDAGTGVDDVNKGNDDYDGLTEGERRAIHNSRDGKNPDGSERKPTDTEGFNFNTDKNGKKLNDKDVKEPKQGHFGRNKGRYAKAVAVPVTIASLALMNKQGTKPAGNGTEVLEEAPDSPEEAEIPIGMSPDGGFERDADGSLSAAGLHAFLEKGRRHRASRPNINTGTQTMGNWIR